VTTKPSPAPVNGSELVGVEDVTRGEVNLVLLVVEETPDLLDEAFVDVSWLD
jgi:hypothetical protein